MPRDRGILGCSKVLDVAFFGLYLCPCLHDETALIHSKGKRTGQGMGGQVSVVAREGKLRQSRE